MNVYGDLSTSQLPDGNWQETEEAYVEMSGGLIDTLPPQNTESLKRSMEHNTRPMESSSLTDGYVDMNTLTRKRKEMMKEAIKCSSKKIRQKKTKLCTMVYLTITMSAVISVVVSMATQMLLKYVIYDNESSSDHPATFNYTCSSWIAARCTLTYTDNNTYECTTEDFPIRDKGLIAVGIECVQLSGQESLLIATSLIIEEESNEAKCSCVVKNDSNKNIISTLICGIWIRNCSPNNNRS